jgi:hypothetical protein
LDPEFEMLRVRIDVDVSHDPGLELSGSCDNVREVVHFKPKKNAIAYRLSWIANGTMMMVGAPIM